MGSSENLPLIGIDGFLKEVEEIQQLTASYDENLDLIESIQNKLLRISWTQKVREELSLELEVPVAKNKDLQKVILQKLKLGWSRPVSNETYERIRKEKMTTLTEKVMESLAKSQTQEINFRDKLRLKFVQTMKITCINKSDEEILRHLDSNQISSLCSESILGDTDEARQQLEEITSRHAQLKSLEEDIQELVDLFKQMKELVELQGCKVDTAEQKIEETSQTIRSTLDILRDARQYFDKAMENKRLVGIVTGSLLTFLFLILIISLLRPHSSSVETITIIKPTESDPDICDPATDPMCVG